MKWYCDKRVGLSLLIILTLQSLQAQIQWTSDGVKAGTSDASLTNISAVSDGQGGAFLTYEDNLSPDINIKAQWLDGSGTPRWGSNGTTVNAEGLNQKNPAIAPDGNGGCYIAWLDEGTSRIKVQHLNSGGNPLWNVNGIYVTNTTASQSSVKAVSDEAGGVILVWKDERNYITTGVDIHAQRLDSQGNQMWTTVGKVVTEAAADQSQHAIAINGSGGVVVVWTDYRNLATTNTDIYVQNLNAAGTRLWHDSGSYEGIPVCNAVKAQNNATIIHTGGKISIAWSDKRNDQYDIYAQLLETNGDVAWSTVNGKLICNASGDQTVPELCAVANNGVIVAWQDARVSAVYADIYAQRMNVGGTRIWAANGVPVVTSENWAGYPKMVSDDANGAIISWMDNRNTHYDIYSQHIDSNGNPAWNSGGYPLCNASQHQYWHSIVTDGSGGAITLWQDSRSGASDVYAQLTNDNLTIDAPVSGTLWAGSQAQTIEWTFHTSQVDYHHFTIQASSTPGDGFPTTVATNVSPSALSRTWTPGTINSTTVQLRILAYNSSNVRLGRFFSDVFTIDSDPPDTFNLTSPGNGSVTDLKPSFQWQATLDNLTGVDHYELFIDGQMLKGNLQANSYTLTTQEQLSDGPHTWYVRAVDGAGQARPSATWNFTSAEDNTPPNPFNLTAPANNSWTQNLNPQFSWEAATDDITGIHHYKLFVDGGTNPIADDITGTSINTVTLAVGSHTWYVVAVDSAFNERTSTQTWTVKIDNVLPQAFSLTAPADNAWQNTDTPEFSWQASQDNGSGLAEYELYFDSESTPRVDDIAPGVTQIILPQNKALSEGTHTWYIVARDVLGNSRASGATYTVGVDITPPEAFNITAPVNNAFVDTQLPTFTWQAATDAVSEISEYKLRIDGVIDRENLTGTSTTPSSPLSEGPHTWEIKAYDLVGNIQWSSIWNFTVDTEPPAAFNLISPAASETVYHNRPTLSWQTTTDATAGFDRFEVYVDNQKVADKMSAQQTEHTLSAALDNGDHTWKVLAFDKAGNSRRAGPRDFTTQVTAPVITSAGNAQATEDIYFSYTATAQDAENDLLTYSFQNYPNWLSWDGATISGTPTEGTTSSSFTVKVNDGIFEVTKQVNLTVTAVDDPPQITSPASADAVEDQDFSYTVTAIDPENDPITYSFSDYPGWMTVSGVTIQGAPPEGVTSVTFKAHAAANGKSDELQVTISVAGVDDPPQITSANTGNATEDIEFVYTATATDPENDAITFSYPIHPDWMTVSGAVIRGAPPEGVTAFSFRVRASANGKTVRLDVNVTVQAVDDAPVITSGNTVNATEDVEFTYTATATDAENDPITLAFSQVPDWMQVTGNTIQGTPTEGITAATFTVTATANGKTDQETVAVNITAVDDPPQITSPASGSGKEDVLFTYTATATDAENDPIVFTFSNHPDWLTGTGAVIQGAPPNGLTNFQFTVTATANGKSDALDVAVTVETVNDPPQITSADTVIATEDQHMIYEATAVDEENDPFSITILNLPSWLALNNTTVSGTPANGQADTLFTVIAASGALSDTQDVYIIIRDVNDPPQITSPDTAEATEHQLFSYSVTAADIDGPNISVQFLMYPDWMKPMGRLIRGTVPANCQDTAFRVIVSDNHETDPLTDTLNVTVLVEQINDPPVFSISFPEPEFQDPDTVRWVLALDDYVEDPDNADSELTWTYTLIDSQGVNIVIDPATHKASILATGMYTDFHIAFTVRDPQLASATDTLTIGVVMTGVEQKIGAAPETFTLSPNYPNPFNPSTTIRYGVPVPSHVRLTIFNIQGQIVETLIDKQQMPGMYELKWNGSGTATGIYFYRIETDSWQQVRRMILIK